MIYLYVILITELKSLSDNFSQHDWSCAFILGGKIVVIMLFDVWLLS